MTVDIPEEEIDSDLSPLQKGLIIFTGCVGEAVEDMCSYGLTIGDSYVPFDPDPEDDCGSEDDEMICSQLWVRVTNVTAVEMGDDGFGGDFNCHVSLSVDLEVGVLRCIEINEDGEAPTASQVLAAAMQSMEDMTDIQCAALNCEEAGWEQINLGAWTPMGPLGGQYGGIWTFTVMV